MCIYPPLSKSRATSVCMQPEGDPHKVSPLTVIISMQYHSTWPLMEITFVQHLILICRCMFVYIRTHWRTSKHQTDPQVTWNGSKSKGSLVLKGLLVAKTSRWAPGKTTHQPLFELGRSITSCQTRQNWSKLRETSWGFFNWASRASGWRTYQWRDCWIVSSYFRVRSAAVR